ncbi:hypothetical protein [Saliphagus infecundisoli]|uniref:DUF7991 domain-containing protein n=1 Tax=Saliphagus infecundisoli TaxID=1849069 RepID=A0ABD5QBH2_9EURY|nr:hypothetical protein [Saliphagus infecundisoli]
MVSFAAGIGLLVMMAAHTVIAAVATRFFRIRLESTWGPAVYTVLLVPVALVASTLFLSGTLGIGADLGSTGMALMLMVVAPLALGYTIDVFWMPHPDEVELPERADG